MRPGAMWFIKDPQDQNSHPIRDIIDRPTLSQFRKICVSGVMYAVVVLLVVASVGGLLILGNKSIMPIRWKNRYPIVFHVSTADLVEGSRSPMCLLTFSSCISYCPTPCTISVLEKL